MATELQDLSIYRKQIEFIRETAAQIIKDFEIAGEEISFSGNAETAYAELKSQILPIVEKLLQSNFEKFLFLLYKIDVSENAVKNILAENEKVFSENICDLILERELKKVIVRKYFEFKK